MMSFAEYVYSLAFGTSMLIGLFVFVIFGHHVLEDIWQIPSRRKIMSDNVLGSIILLVLVSFGAVLGRGSNVLWPPHKERAVQESVHAGLLENVEEVPGYVNMIKLKFKDEQEFTAERNGVPIYPGQYQELIVAKEKQQPLKLARNYCPEVVQSYKK